MNAALKQVAATAVLALAGLGACTGIGRGVSVSSEDYTTAYDYGDFREASDGKEFPVLIAGNPFPAFASPEVNRQLLLSMQANKPRPRLTFTLGTVPGAPPRPSYRLVLLFDAAADMTASKACKGDLQVGAHAGGQLALFAVYCRDDLPLSQAVGRTTATGLEDPAVGRLFRDVFQTVFTDSEINHPDLGYPGGLR